jgi:hypothetical protein
MAIEKRKGWDLFLELEFPDFVGSELNFWLQNISSDDHILWKIFSSTSTV